MREPVRAFVVVLRGFAYVWLTLAVLVIVTGLGWILVTRGFLALTEVLSPFNVVNWIATAVLLAPGFGALAWANSLQARVDSQHGQQAPGS